MIALVGGFSPPCRMRQLTTGFQSANLQLINYWPMVDELLSPGA